MILFNEKKIPWENLPIECTYALNRIVRSFQRLPWDLGRFKESAAQIFGDTWEKVCFFQL